MSIVYEAYLHTPDNVRIATLPEVFSLEYTRVLNAPGVLTMTLPRSYYNRFALDSRIELYRDGALATDTQWIVRAFRQWIDSDGRELLQVTAYSALELLSRRIVAYKASTSQARKNGAADDLIHEIVNENFAGVAGQPIGARDIDVYLSSGTSASAAPTAAKGFAYRNVLSVCQEIAAASREAGTPLFFDVVLESGLLTLKTYIGQRGTDRRFPNGFILGTDLGNLEEPELTEDYTDAANVVYSAGQGEETSRDLLAVKNDARAVASVLAWKEVHYDGRNNEDANELFDGALSRLREGIPRVTYSGRLVDQPGTAYGTDWQWGDRFTASFFGQTVSVWIDKIDVRYERGEEDVSSQLEGEA